MRKISNCACLFLIVAAPIVGQDTQTPVAPAAPNQQNLSKSDNAAVEFLTTRYRLKAQDAKERLTFQSEVIDLANKLASENPDQFGGVFIDQEPVYKIIVLFKDADSRNALRETISPQLRKYVQIKKAARSEVETRDIINQLSNSFAAGSIRNSVGFDPRNQKFNVTVASQADANEIKKLIPKSIDPDVIIKVGLLPEDAQAGYANGDYTYGGWSLYRTTSTSAACTSGYIVRLSDGTNGVTTASHCSDANYRIYVNGHYVTLAAAKVVNGSGLYDFKVHPTGSLTVSGYIPYINNVVIQGTSITNSVPGYANTGYFGIKNGIYRISPTLGSIMCKSGQTTGLTCGEITNTYVNYTTDKGVARQGMVEVGKSTQRVISFGGDSGGPVFTTPASDGTIMPAGTVVGASLAAANTPCDTSKRSDCVLYYMPIDRINDLQPMQIITMSGTLNS